MSNEWLFVCDNGAYKSKQKNGKPDKVPSDFIGKEYVMMPVNTPFEEMKKQILELKEVKPSKVQKVNKKKGKQ